ncbi:aminodeoxychorismate synthase component I [Sphingomonas paeninsulae]|uniref:Probable branched-chain-amino-acid aminotransferase n=1 Tax=Sphingomonas paeninsulae TaxID=2319844 RepID=A0A494TMB2_SPHPE|nr:aminodeoxychorismate synthase component I [Sphingomonas paeninsulae]AYJ86578.1 aminodeoxychorismate synthase component I [Sphingomonas paeninsulae]
MIAALPSDGTPFVLLDDARAVGAVAARLYVDPVQVVATRKPSEIVAALKALRAASTGGLHAAGFLTYEAGGAIAGGAVSEKSPELPLLWFGLFRTFTEIAADQVAALLPDPLGAWAGAPKPEIDRATYDRSIAGVQALIAAGDIYQANLTFRAHVATAGHPLALYAGLRGRASAGYGGIVHTGADWLLSLSPELFFDCRDGVLTARPMKGTATRYTDAVRDRAAVVDLSSDKKQRAENLMIVDLMRNDLSRVAVPGSVEVPALFAVETYPTVHQMTSTVTALLQPEKDAIDVLSALFPCGSITGAPKLRAMEVIADIEQAVRGAYTGSIGRIDAGARDAVFNVAIRTLQLGESATHMGLGSGIVADSRAGPEWSECLAKGVFVASNRRFDLIETMAFDPLAGLTRLETHLERMKNSAELFGFTFDRHAARNELQAATFRLRIPSRVRLLLAKSGAMAVETKAISEAPLIATVVVAPLPVDPRDFRLLHKTTDRNFYDDARRKSGAFEVLFTDCEGFLTEGSFTNIFVPCEDSLLTPPLEQGLLGGVLRNQLIQTGIAKEAKLRVDDLGEQFFIGNSLRGLLLAQITGL